ncbi:uncharacterized protein [Henckelia pumila]|uniref:uncharacterized protein n=1 Tax=Henckelia pumila TaxID=405737 RepID=UPI003C6E6BDE
MGQLATATNKLEAQHSNALPSQTIPNPRENASTITLRNGKELKVKEKEIDASSKKEKNEEPKVDDKEATQEEASQDAIKHVPRYAKFLKELCTKKRKQALKGCQKVELGNVRLEKTMLDLGASINVMPYSIYASLKLPLNKTQIVMQLADRYNAYPRGVVENVLVQVNILVFPADFYVLDMENGDHNSPILLGRPFLKTSMTKIDIHSGTLTMEFDGVVVKFNIYDAMKFSNNDDCVYSVDIVDYLAQEHSPIQQDDDEGICCNGEVKEIVNTLNSAPELPQSGNLAYLSLPISNTLRLPSVLQAPVIELKMLPKHLNLEAEQEEKLVAVLKEHKTAIGWTIADIKRISL